MPSLVSTLIRLAPVSAETRISLRRAAIEHSYGRDIKAAQKRNDSVAAQDLDDARAFEVQLVDEDGDAVATRRLITKAMRLRVPVPDHYGLDGRRADAWEQGDQTGRWHLSPTAFAALRNEVRQEARARHEARGRWLPWIAAITGVIGALTGLAAILNKLSS